MSLNDLFIHSCTIRKFQVSSGTDSEGTPYPPTYIDTTSRCRFVSRGSDGKRFYTDEGLKTTRLPQLLLPATVSIDERCSITGTDSGFTSTYSVDGPVHYRYAGTHHPHHISVDLKVVE